MLNLKNKIIVITRPKKESLYFKKILEKYLAKVYLFPSIKIVGNMEDVRVKKALSTLSDYDWIIFTSGNSVEFLFKAITSQKTIIKILESKKIAVVGPKTGEKLKKYNLNIDFIPTKFTTLQLAKEIKITKGEKILLPRSDISPKKFVKGLQNKGAVVTDISIYKTEFILSHDLKFEDLVKKNKISFLTFYSPSTVTGFLKRLEGSDVIKRVKSLPTISIGPVTTKTAKKLGFTNVFTANTYTTHGIFEKLLEIA